MWTRGPKRAVSAELHPVVHLGEADEDEGEERRRIPLVVGEDVQMVEDVLMKQMDLVEEEDGVHPTVAELGDVMVDRVEDSGGGRLGTEAESKAELPVEIAPTQCGIVTVGQPKTIGGKAMADGAKDTGLADPGLPGKQDVTPLVTRVDDPIDDAFP